MAHVLEYRIIFIDFHSTLISKKDLPLVYSMLESSSATQGALLVRLIQQVRGIKNEEMLMVRKHHICFSDTHVLFRNQNAYKLAGVISVVIHNQM